MTAPADPRMGEEPETGTAVDDADPTAASAMPGAVASGSGIAVGRDNAGITATGDNVTIHQNSTIIQQLPRQTPLSGLPAPDGLTHLPPLPAEFVGRTDELARLHQALARPAQVVVAAVHGLGGIGKSTLAARYAADHAASFHPVWWITADSPAAIRQGLADLAVSLQEHPSEQLELEELARRAMVWLAARTGWLLICDNVTDPAHIRDLLSRLRSGRIIVTSRLREGWQRLGARVLRLDVLDEDEAVDLLTRLALPDSPAPDRWPGARELVAELGCLPLAVEQAGAYLHQTSLTPADYLALLREQPEVLFDQTAEGSESERTVARIWRVTLDHLTTRTPHAGALLRTLAWMSSEAIPRTLLRLPTRPDGPPSPQTAAERVRLEQALGVLAAYNMVDLTPETVTVHRLVQAVARTPDPDDPHRRPGDIDAARGHAADLLLAALPGDVDDPATWSAVRVLLPHVDALISRSSPETDTTATCLLLTRTGRFLEGQGAIKQAIAYCERSLAASERLHGPRHPDTLASRNNLAYAYRTAGDLGRAIPLFETTLTDSERVLGTDHPTTQVVRGNLEVARRSGESGRQR